MNEWPARGGANGSIRFEPEISHGANAGLKIALNLLKPIQKKYPAVSYADLFQMASAAAVEVRVVPCSGIVAAQKCSFAASCKARYMFVALRQRVCLLSITPLQNRCEAITA
jgi:catalase (peroxidase I)